MKNPKVSILIPLYNSESYIIDTLKSACNQTYKNIEIIVIDDGSTDRSYDIASNYEHTDKSIPIKVLQQTNQGAQKTRNDLFKLSTGEYIQYLDADDIIDQFKIEAQINLLINESFDVISFGKWTCFF